jgi:hypothetical protein
MHPGLKKYLDWEGMADDCRMLVNIGRSLGIDCTHYTTGFTGNHFRYDSTHAKVGIMWEKWRNWRRLNAPQREAFLALQ